MKPRMTCALLTLALLVTATTTYAAEPAPQVVTVSGAWARATPPGTAVAVVSARAEARARVTPAARRRAGELGVALAGLAGSGPEGAVTLADVERADVSVEVRAPDTAPPHAH